MHSHIRSGFIVAAAAISLMSSAALAQTAEPKAGAETSSVTAVTVSTTKWMTQETADQWRASKLIGLNVYNDSSEKNGDIQEGACLSGVLTFGRMPKAHCAVVAPS